MVYLDAPTYQSKLGGRCRRTISVHFGGKLERPGDSFKVGVFFRQGFFLLETKTWWSSSAFFEFGWLFMAVLPELFNFVCRDGENEQCCIFLSVVYGGSHFDWFLF